MWKRDGKYGDLLCALIEYGENLNIVFVVWCWHSVFPFLERVWGKESNCSDYLCA